MYNRKQHTIDHDSKKSATMKQLTPISPPGPLSCAVIAVACLALAAEGCAPGGPRGPVFTISFDAEVLDDAVDGRVLLMLAKSDEEEPRFQVRSGVRAIPIYGVDVEGQEPGEEVRIDADTFGYPFESLSDLPAGEYLVQAVLHRYETFHLSTGHTVKLPMDRGEGQQWNRAPGNLYSTPRKIQVDPTRAARIEILLDQVIPPIEPPQDTKYIRHVKIQSERLTKFWGRPMYLGAHVLVPEGFDEHPEARYPLIISHGHFPADFGGFRTEPPDPTLEPDYSERYDLHGYNRIRQQEAYDFYRKWTDREFPRMLIIVIQHANPYYDDSYAVNSANLGPYGDAITYELIPHIEKQFRGIGEGWARDPG